MNKTEQETPFLRKLSSLDPILYIYFWSFQPSPMTVKRMALISLLPCISWLQYLYIWGFRARQHPRSLAPVMKWLWMMMMMATEIRGPNGPKASWHSSYRWGKTPKKTSPEPAMWQARMLPPVPQRWTLIVKKLQVFINSCLPIIMGTWLPRNIKKKRSMESN